MYSVEEADKVKLDGWPAVSRRLGVLSINTMVKKGGPMTRSMFLILCLVVAPIPLQADYFWDFSGKLVYTNGSEQTFNGFRCLYSGGLHYSRNLESLSPENYPTTAEVRLEGVARINFSERPNTNVRRGTVRFRNGKTLEDVLLYVEECSWTDRPNLKGKLNDPDIASLVIIGVPKR